MSGMGVQFAVRRASGRLCGSVLALAVLLLGLAVASPAQARIYWATSAPARSGAPSRTAPAPIMASSPAPDPRAGWRSTTRTSTGSAAATTARSGARTWTARGPTRTSSPAPATPQGWRSTAPTSTGRTMSQEARSPEQTSTGRAPTRSLSAAPAFPPGSLWTAPTSTGRTTTRARSGAPTSTAPPPPRALSPSLPPAS